MKRLTPHLIFIAAIFLMQSCSESLPEIENLSNEKFELINHNNVIESFPSNVKGKIVVAGYIFTNCPDICPLTTNNMRLIQEQLKKGNVENVEFVSISFDPLNDTPEVLKKFAEIRNLDLSNWKFFTGEKETIDSLLLLTRVMAVPSDSTIFSDGKKIYYYVHTDRIQLIDSKGIIRKNYTGSKINIEEIINDIKILLEE